MPRNKAEILLRKHRNGFRLTDSELKELHDAIFDLCEAVRPFGTHFEIASSFLFREMLDLRRYACHRSAALHNSLKTEPSPF